MSTDGRIPAETILLNLEKSSIDKLRQLAEYILMAIDPGIEMTAAQQAIVLNAMNLICMGDGPDNLYFAAVQIATYINSCRD